MGKHCSDEKVMELLGKAGAKCSLHGVYGLFHGCIAAPHMVLPSEFFHLIMDDDAEFESRKELNEFFGSLMALWNRIANWDPETEPFRWPSVYFPPTFKGLKNRAEQCSSFITLFLKGLELGGTLKFDFQEEALYDLELIEECQNFLRGCAELSEAGEDSKDADIQKAMELMDRYEELIGDCIARINLGLKPARMRVLEEMRGLVESEKRERRARSVKTGRNDPCPCGSGKKYKKCCMEKGSVH